MRNLVNGILAAIAGAACAAVLCIVPYVGIRRALPVADLQWQEVACWVILVLAAAIGLGRIYSADAKLRLATLANLELAADFAAHKPSASGKERALLPPWAASVWLKLSRRSALIGGLLYVFLYNASIALCLRLHLLQIPDQPLLLAVLRPIGLALVVAGVAFQLKAVFSSFAQPLSSARLISVCKTRHPILFGWILILAGLPLAFGVWMPIVAIPGVFVGLNWRLEQKEMALKELLGDDYIKLQTTTWRLVPFIGKQPQRAP